MNHDMGLDDQYSEFEYKDHQRAELEPLYF